MHLSLESVVLLLLAVNAAVCAGVPQSVKDKAPMLWAVLDAVAINAIAICSNEVNDVQAEVIETLDRDIIVVPDRDKAGKAMVDAALKYGWSVSFPDWGDGIKDVADAVAKYGHTFTMKSILQSVESNSLKIKLMTKKWF